MENRISLINAWDIKMTINDLITHLQSGYTFKLGPQDVWYVFVVRYV